MKDMSNYFCTYISCLLNFDIDDVLSFDIKYFFIAKDSNMYNMTRFTQL